MSDSPESIERITLVADPCHYRSGTQCRKLGAEGRDPRTGECLPFTRRLGTPAWKLIWADPDEIIYEDLHYNPIQDLNSHIRKEICWDFHFNPRRR